MLGYLSLPIPRYMDNYEIIQQIGDGGFGTVYRARRLDTDEPDLDQVVAIKRLKAQDYTWAQCLELREVKALKRLEHPNIVQLFEVIRENHNVYLIFEFVDENLFDLMKTRETPYEESTIKNILKQILRGLTHIHDRGFMHRDIKPENLLCKSNYEIVKIADFGLTRNLTDQRPLTDYVATRWYRAPELLLGAERYDTSIDIWALGCIAGELYNLNPLFPGNGDLDQLLKISRVLGSPDLSNWPSDSTFITAIEFNIPNVVPLELADLIPYCSPLGLDLLDCILRWLPNSRLTARQLLAHDYFKH